MAKKENNKTTDKKNKENPLKGVFDDIRGGKTISMSTLRDNAWIIVVVIVCILSLMGLRYETKTKMEKIKRLNAELIRAESSKLQEKAEYMSLIRETEMKRMVEEKGLNLTFQEQPPFELIEE